MSAEIDANCMLKTIGWILLIVSIIYYLARTILRAVCSPYPQVAQHESERYFFDPNSKYEKLKFPSILSVPTVDLTVIVPSYNEEIRLPNMLNEAIDHLEKRRKNNNKFKYEIIVVDDGSTDSTTKVALEYSKRYSTDLIRVLTLHKNRGKGGAIRMGVLRSRGQLILFADADGATKFSDIEKLESALNKNTKNIQDDEIVVCGSRRHLEKESVAERSLLRTILMYGFHFMVWLLCVKGVRDTQCGFKLFTRSAALKSFSNLHIQRWAFDVDLLYIASHFRMKILEVDVNWKECEGSKVTVASWIQMGKDLVSIRLHYFLGAWKLNENLRIED